MKCKLLLSIAIIASTFLGYTQQKESIISVKDGYKSKSFDFYSFAEDIVTYQGIHTSGSAIEFSSWDDAVCNPIDIGFNFTFNGIEYSTFTVNTNGTINLGNNSINEETNYLESDEYYNLLAPLWDDLKFWNNGDQEGVFYELAGEVGSQILTVEFYQIGRYNVDGNDQGYVNFQVKLFETDNHIEFIYDDLSNAANWHFAAAASIGLNAHEFESTVFLSVTPDNENGATYSLDIPNNNITADIVENIEQGTRYSFNPPVISNGVDLSIAQLISPVPGIFSGAEIVSVTFGNIGETVTSNVSLQYEIIDVVSDEVIEQAIENYTNYPINTYETRSFEFLQTADLSANGLYKITVKILVENDVDTTNNILVSELQGVIISDTLYNNGDFVTHEREGYNNADVSAVQVNLGFQDFGYNTSAILGYRNADQFVVPEDTAWIVNGFSFYHHQTESGENSTINYVDFNIWQEAPSESGTPFLEYTSDNMLSATFWTGVYRAPSNDLMNTDRPIMQSVCKFPHGEEITLTPGVYWIDYAADGELLSGPWQNFISIVDSLTTGDAMHFGSEGWVTMTDGGTSTKQGMPFLVHGVSEKINSYVQNKHQLSIYPNPTTNIVYLDNMYNSICTLMNLNGSVIYKEKVDKVLDLSEFSSGIYILEIKTKDNVFIEKIIKK